MRLRRLETLVVFIIGSSCSILPIYKISKFKTNYFSNLFSKRINDFLIRYIYGDSGVMEAWKPVELQDRVQFPAIALSSIVKGHHHF